MRLEYLVDWPEFIIPWPPDLSGVAGGIRNGRISIRGRRAWGILMRDGSPRLRGDGRARPSGNGESNPGATCRIGPACRRGWPRCNALPRYRWIGVATDRSAGPAQASWLGKDQIYLQTASRVDLQTIGLDRALSNAEFNGRVVTVMSKSLALARRSA